MSHPPLSKRAASLVFLALLHCLLFSVSTTISAGGADDAGDVAPHVFVALQTRNNAFLLRNFFGYLENLDYPKDRISMWIRTDHNVDDTAEVLGQWCRAAREVYLSVDCHASEELFYPAHHPYPESHELYEHVARLRQKGLDAARESKADYYLSINVDNFLTNNQTLRLLIAEKKIVTTPMLKSAEGAAFSNFWMDQDSRGYYKRHEDYIPILRRNFTGCFRAPVLLPPLLIDLSAPKSKGLVYHPPPSGFNGPPDDVVQFAFSAKTEEVAMFVCNFEPFGYIIKPESHSSVEAAAKRFIDFKVETLVNHPPIPSSQFIPPLSQSKDNMGLDAVYMIGLARRPERRNRMIACLEELNFDYIVFDAVDGRQLNASYVEEELGIQYMSNWRDPWGNRTMTFGEVGCFLSHYTIWNKVIDEGLQRVLVLEDDIDFEPRFRDGLMEVMKEAEMFTPTWDLIYMGRKRLHMELEPNVHGTRRLVRPLYSYWTLGYLLSDRGARKLLEADPFHSFLPVDEYFPILFGQHPRNDWAKHYPNQTLEVYSANPLLLYPTYYVGDAGWYSDTEPPPEVLAQIRARKREEQKEYEQQMEEVKGHQKEVKDKAVQRQIELMKKKLKPKSEL
jgi:collagen beta-1,O-galactosyltransferase